MARKRPDSRFADLIRCATDTFIRTGSYGRTQMADIARAMGVSPGTLYLYVESKEALFDLIIRYADNRAPVETPGTLPIPTPKPGATLKYVKELVEQKRRLPTLEQALGEGPQGTPREELLAIFHEYYDMLDDNREAIKLGDCAAVDHPELAGGWFVIARNALVERFREYLCRRIDEGRLLPMPDTAYAAQMILEVCTMSAVHRHWIKDMREVDDEVARETAAGLVVGLLLGGRPAGQTELEFR